MVITGDTIFAPYIQECYIYGLFDWGMERRESRGAPYIQEQFVVWKLL